jgi:hypothetical protein
LGCGHVVPRNCRRHLLIEDKGEEMGKLNGVELKRARLVPSAMFTSPAAVVRSADLSRAQKIQILRRWEFDARRTTNGDPTALPGNVTGLLHQVRGALAALGALAPAQTIAGDTVLH